MIKKRLIVFVGFVLVFSSASTTARAQTIDELQAQLTALQAQLQLLLDRASDLGVTPTGIDGANIRFHFSEALYRGTTDETTNGEVSMLQEFLAQDASIYPEGIISGYFGALTEKAVERWQARHGIVSSGTPATTGYGVVGPRTRAALNSGGTYSGTPISPTSTASTTQGSTIGLLISSNLTVQQPITGTASASNTISVALVSGESRTVTLTQIGLPAGATAAALGSCVTPCSKINTITIKPTTPSGTSTVVITAKSGTSTVMANFTLSVVSSTPFVAYVTSTRTVAMSQPTYANATTTMTLNVGLTSGLTRQVTLSQSGFPTGVSAAALPKCSPPCSIANTLTVRPLVPLGTYPITVALSVDGKTSTTTYNLVIGSPVAFSFGLTNSNNITLSRPIVGTLSATNTIATVLLGGQSRPVTMSQNRFPTGATVAALGSCTPPCSKINTITIKPTTPVGVSTITVTGSAGEITGTTEYELAVVEHVPYVFSLNNSGDIFLVRPQSGTASGHNTIHAAVEGGAAQPVSFSERGLPTGAGATFVASCTPPCSTQNTITITSNTPTGEYPVIVSGDSGESSSTTEYYLVVTED